MTIEPLEIIAADTGAGAIAMMLIKSSLLICLGLGLRCMLRRASASARHLVLGATMVSILFLPAISAFVPALELPFLLEEESLSADAASDRQAASPLVNVDARSSNESSRQAVATDPTDQVNLLIAAYVVGLVIALAYLTTGVARVRWLSHRATEVTQEPEWRRFTEQHTGRIKLLRSHDVHVPLTWGIRAPEILLPASAQEWSEDDKRHALLHELAHVNRQDWLVQVIARLVCAIYWFNPLV